MATIPHVTADTIIESAAQNAFIDEVNNVCAKRTGTTISGTYIFANSQPAFRLRRTGEAPFFTFESVAGTRLAYVQADPTSLRLNTDGTTIAFLIGDAIKATLDAGALDIAGLNLYARAAVLARNDNANQIIIADYSAATSGIAAHAFIGFYPNAASASSFGSRGGYLGFNGEGFQMQADIGPVVVQSVAADVAIEAATAVTINPADAVYVGKSAADPATVGTEIFTATHATPTVRGQIRNTVGVAGAENMQLRHVSAASADGQKFISFHNAAGTELGSISQQGSGIRINNDVLLDALVQRIADLEAKVATLEAR